MSRDPLDKLARFTPAAGGLDRDELLFRAGRASARTPRGWKVAAGVLATTQAATLALWLGGGSGPPPTAPTAVAPEAPPAPAYPAADPSSYLALSRSWDGEPPTRPAPAGPSGDRPGPVLTAGWRGEPIN
jgi:hypothetical protein